MLINKFFCSFFPPKMFAKLLTIKGEGERAGPVGPFPEFALDICRCFKGVPFWPTNVFERIRG